ncbi:MAG: CBS domain-containing protein [Clostridia bacterium]|nr:CBS domain-containing protein [Clostridia bacterium]
MYVKNRMTSNPYTVSPDATIAEALEIMRENKIRRLPVVKSGELVGIVTDREMLEVSPSKATTLSVFEINYLLSKTKVGTIMTKDVIMVSSNDLLEEALVRMKDNDVDGLPVVDDGKLVGIITESDVFDAFIEILGFRDTGSRITVEIEDDKPGILAKIAGIIADFNVSITHIAVFRNEIVFRVNAINVKGITDEIEKNGYRIISVLKNE